MLSRNVHCKIVNAKNVKQVTNRMFWISWTEIKTIEYILTEHNVIEVFKKLFRNDITLYIMFTKARHPRKEKI